MIDKRTTGREALQNIQDGATVMVGGFGVPGTPFILVDELLSLGRSNLTLIKNEANEDHMGVSKLIEAGRVSRLITSHLGLNRTVLKMMNQGEIEVEFYPQGILAEKIRAGGAGLHGFVTDIGIDTILAESKTRIELHGRELIFEPALRADLALVHAKAADSHGNLAYTKSARNFNPAMATAADHVVAEAEEVVPPGGIDPDQVHTPGVFVDAVVPIEELTSEYGVLAHHVVQA
jgi:acetate CoA/acetoacetate CoA-transferase alpha subunit